MTRWILFAAVLALAPAASSQVTTLQIATGLEYPVYVTSPPGDTHRLFVVQQAGKIRLIKDGQLSASPFLDIESLVHHEAGTELGLLGLAFHPDYATNGYFFVYYTAGPFPLFDVVRRYQVSSNPDSAVVASGQRMLRISDPFGNHNGGQIAFGEDGYFYMAPGDGGSGGDPDNRAQNPGELLGKMLRIDLDADDFPSDPLTNYAIPPDNPFVASADTLPEIWAFGLRNPYRWSFDRLTGDLYIGDVGQGEWEEIDFEPASSPGGLNYGWHIMEGNHCFEPPTDCDSTGLVLPVLEYDHPTGFSIIGGYVYRGSAIPAIAGHYFLADYVTDLVWSFRIDNGQAVDLTDWGPVLNPGGEIQSVTGFGEDANGELYFVLHGDGTNGQVRKMIPDSTSGPPPGPPIHAFQLSSARPNPFRETTQFTLQLPRSGDVRVTLHDSSGRKVRTIEDRFRSSGIHAYTWDGKDDEGNAQPSGIYFIRADVEGTILSSRVTHLR